MTNNESESSKVKTDPKPFNENAQVKSPNAQYLTDPSKYHNKCEDVVNQAIEQNPFLQHIILSMEKVGCDITRSFFKCRSCPLTVGGFYDSKLGLVLCENQISFQRTIEDTLMHEMIHAYDHCRANIDTDDCVQIACTEIRAANLSNECNWSREIFRRQFGVQRHYPDCVKRRAHASLQQHTKCSDRASFYVDVAWRSCYRDTDPFGFVPH